MSETVAIKLRTCTRCGHEECPCCRDFCDLVECIGADESDPTKCGDLSCTYADPIDTEGYAWLDAALDRAGSLPSIHSEGTGEGLIVYTREEIDALDKEENDRGQTR